MTIHKKIRQVREFKNLTQEYVAGKLNITQTSYSKIERGETKLDVDKLHKIVAVLEVALQDLLSSDSKAMFTGGNISQTISQLSTSVEGIYQERIKEQCQEIERLHKIIEKLLNKS